MLQRLWSSTSVRPRLSLMAVVTIGLHLAPTAVHAADPREVALGRQLAEGALLDSDHTCSRCHGVLGIGRPEEGTPRLAGQPHFYLRKQLQDFVSGTRQSEKMEPVARALSAEQRDAVAAYFASLHFVPYPPVPEVDPALVQRGGILSAVGDEDREIRACEICHADAGVGLPPSFPYLAGQYAYYLERQLLAWKRGQRTNDPLDVMADIARQLGDDEIRALALYFARVRPPLDSLSSPIPDDPIPPPPDDPSVPD